MLLTSVKQLIGFYSALGPVFGQISQIRPIFLTLKNFDVIFDITQGFVA